MEAARIRFGFVQLIIVILVLTTAAIHLSLMFPDPMFILNGLGYLGLVAAYFLPLPIPLIKDRKRLIRYVLIGYTLLTIVLWIIMGERSTVGYVAKAVETALVVLLFVQRP